MASIDSRDGPRDARDSREAQGCAHLATPSGSSEQRPSFAYSHFHARRNNETLFPSARPEEEEEEEEGEEETRLRFLFFVQRSTFFFLCVFRFHRRHLHGDGRWRPAITIALPIKDESSSFFVFFWFHLHGLRLFIGRPIVLLVAVDEQKEAGIESLLRLVISAPPRAPLFDSF